MNIIQDALQKLHHGGVRQIDIYYAEIINDGETDWSVDVMCDIVNDITGHSWTWTVSSLAGIENILGNDKYFVCTDWEIIANEPFDENVVRGAIEEWLIANGIDICVQVIDIDDAVGSGYVKQLREIDVDYEISNSVPLRTLYDEKE